MERTTDAAFSTQEADRIRERARTPGAPVDCPRCGGRLTFHGPMTQEATGAEVICIRCATCRRRLVVSGLPP